MAPFSRLTRSNVLWGTGIALGLGLAIALVAALATGTLKFGIGAGTITATSEKTDSQGKVIERTITTTPQDPKTLWDWLNLGGVLAVPITLAILATWLQHKQQERELKIAEDNRQEEALQHYLDRVSNLLIEKNLLAIATSQDIQEYTNHQLYEIDEQRPQFQSPDEDLLDASSNVIRAVTLSTLRRLSDGSRKASVVQFLIETAIITRLKVSLKGADLSSAFLGKIDLISVDLEGADLRSANLRNAKLRSSYSISTILKTNQIVWFEPRFINLKGANLYSADLRGAYLFIADLRSANLSDADLGGANFDGANLSGANLTGAEGLTKEQLEKAYLCGTKLPQGIDIDLNRDCSKPYDEWLSEKIEELIALSKEREVPPLEE